jgi:DNA-binding NarL/FixJ family response regulator
MSDPIRVAIADDHPIFRRGLRQIIEADPRLQIVAEADDGAMALEQIEQQEPDVAVVDIDMPKKDGFEVARLVREMRLPVGLVFLTMYRDERFFNAALDLEVMGYVLKDSAITDITACIKAVAEGEHFVSPQLSSFILKRRKRAADFDRQQPGLEALTPTERRVLKLIAEGKTTKVIADQMFISPRTVDHHRANICEKLEIKGTHALFKFAVSHRSELL